jgi:MFS family permease
VPNLRGDGETGRLKGGGAVAAQKASIGHTIVFGTLYFLSIALAIPALPNLVNSLVSGDASVSGAGQMKLSSLLSTDAFFTLLTTNVWATMSDKYGRKPFLAMSSTGIGIGAAIIALAPTLKPMYIAAAIDGINSPKSCM